jgi:multiple sugar transport system ATP-binding protein
VRSGALAGASGSADAGVAGTSAAAAPAPASPFLTVCGLSKRFGRTQALVDVHLEARADELLVVLGPTGAGKTTLLRAIAGLEAPEAGSILMAGKDVTALAPAERDVALVFQNFSLYPRWTVRRNLEFPLRAPGRRVAEAEIQRRVGWAADLLKITRLLDREASRLSGGEMQRVAIGRAIVRRPRLFLMDEPLTNLDAKLREALRVELVELRRELRTPMVFVTHDQAEALSMADRIVVLSEGRMLQTGTPREIYERPVSPVVALQLGQPAINLIRVRRVEGHWVAADGTSLMPAESAVDGERLLGIRPENIAVGGSETGGPGAPGPRDAVVEIVEYVGPSTTLLCAWAGARIHIVVPRRGAIRPGDRVIPRIDAARAVLFDVASEPTHRRSQGEPRSPPSPPTLPVLPSKGDFA